MPLAGNALAGKVALVTGSSTGIGAGVAKYFAKLGAALMLTGRDESKLKSVCEECQSTTSRQVCYTVGDVTEDAFVKKLVEETINQHGQLDILVNNAGAQMPTTVSAEGCMEKFDSLMAVNVRSVFYLTHLSIPHLIKTKGNIVNVSSVSSMKPMPSVTPYCMGKAGIDMFTKCLALELAEHGIRVNAVNPGLVAPTDVRRSVGMTKEERDQKYDAAAQMHPLGRYGSITEVAQAIGYLSSEDASWITGSCLVMDGGILHASYKQ